MKLHLAGPTSYNLVSAYGTDYVAINGKRYVRSLIVTPQRIVEDWPPVRVAELTAEHLLALVALKPAVILLATGTRIVFPTPAVLRPLIEARIGHEVMDLAAACRTYNVLAHEGRSVAAAFMLKPDTGNAASRQPL
jgi:uncharacterized protein